MAWSLHRLLREVLPYVLLLLLLVLFAGFTWLTHHPDAAILQRAESWPWIGSLASSFRKTYGPPQATITDVVVERRSFPGLDPPQTVTLPPPGEPMWLLPGAILRQQPNPGAPVIETLDAVTNVVRLEQRGHWYRIYRHGREGWVYLEDYASSGPPYGNEPEAPGPLPGRAPDPGELAAARGILGEDARQITFGPHTVYTDASDAALLAHLDQLTSQLEAAYVARYDRRPAGSPKTVIVLFQYREDYRRLRDQLIQLAGLPASGHHSRGLIALYVGDRQALGVGSTLIHELVHALNRRSLGPALPPWLDEGLADDLAASKVNAEGRLQAEQLNGRVRPEAGHVVISGALGSLTNLRRARAQGRLLPLKSVLAMDWDGFVRTSDISLHYDLSAFWIRYLIQGQGGRYREGFQSFLDGVAAGEPVSIEALESHLDTNLSLIEAGFRSWLEYLARQAQLPDVDPVAATDNGSSSRQTDSPSP